MKKVYIIAAMAALVAPMAIASPQVRLHSKREAFDFERVAVMRSQAREVAADYEWESAGLCNVTDGWILATYGNSVGSQMVPSDWSYNVEIERAVGQNGLYRLINPFSCEAYPALNNNDNPQDAMLYIDARDADFVVIMPQLSGFGAEMYTDATLTETAIYNIVVSDFDGYAMDARGYTELIPTAEDKAAVKDYLTGVQGASAMASKLAPVEVSGQTFYYLNIAPLFGYDDEEEFGAYNPHDVNENFEWLPSNIVLPQGSYDGVADVTVADSEAAPVEYYNLQGVRLSEPRGLCVRKQGAHVTKVLQ